MSDIIRLNTTDAQLHHLASVTHKTKKGTVMVRVNLTALENLIADHGRLCRAVPHETPTEKEAADD